jgi:hypothetical protein
VAWAPDYVSATDIATYLGVSDSVDNALYGVWATAASRAIDRKCNRQFGKLSVAAARTYRRPAYYSADLCMWLVDIDDVFDLTGLLVGGVAYASSGAVLLPDNAPADSRPWTQLGFTSCPTQPLVVTALFGWSAVPTQVTAACYLQAARWNFRRNAPAGVAGSPDSGSEVRLLAKLDPDVSTTLVGLSRRRRAG